VNEKEKAIKLKEEEGKKEEGRNEEERRNEERRKEKKRDEEEKHKYDKNIVEGRVYQIIYHLVDAYIENAKAGKYEDIGTISVESAKRTIPPSVNGFKALEDGRDICLHLSHGVHHQLCNNLEGSLIFFDLKRERCNGSNESYWHIDEEHEDYGLSTMELADRVMQGRKDYLVQRYLGVQRPESAKALLR